MLGRPAEQRTKVFIAHADVDEEDCVELKKRLVPFEQAKHVEVRCKKDVSSLGAVVAANVGDALRSADIVVLLLSADYLALSEESIVGWRVVAEHSKACGARVVPVSMRACAWEQTNLVSMRLLPGGRPVHEWSSRDDAWMAVLQGLRPHIVREPSPASVALLATAAAPRSSARLFLALPVAVLVLVMFSWILESLRDHVDEERPAESSGRLAVDSPAVVTSGTASTAESTPPAKEEKPASADAGVWRSPVGGTVKASPPAPLPRGIAR